MYVFSVPRYGITFDALRFEQHTAHLSKNNDQNEWRGFRGG
jgi:hypothetical protein